MTRRGGISAKYIAIVVLFFLCLYGFYCFHNLYTRLKNAEEKTARLGQQHDSVSAQLQVVYEHKNRLEKSLQQEKTDHQKSKDDMKQEHSELESRHDNEKNELMGRIDSLNQENKMLQMKVEDQELENTKLKEEVSNLQHDAEKRDTQHNEEYLQFKQEKEFEVAQLKDEISNIARKRQDLQYQLNAAVKGQQLNQGQLQNQMQGQVLGQQQQFGQQNNFAGQQQQQQNYPGQQQQNLLNQGQVHFDAQQGLQGQHQNAIQFNQNAQQFAGGQGAGGLGAVHNVNAVQNSLNNAAVQEDAMQIKQPDEKKSYFEPNVPAVADNLEHKLAAEAKHQEEGAQLEGGKVVQEQVIPPKLQPEHGQDGIVAADKPVAHFPDLANQNVAQGDAGHRGIVEGMGAPHDEQVGNIEAPIQQKQEAIRQAHWDVNDHENLDAAQDEDTADQDEEDEEPEGDDAAKEDDDDTDLNRDEDEDEDNLGDDENGGGVVDGADEGENFDAAEDHMDDNKVEQLAMEQNGVVQEKANIDEEVALNNVDQMNAPRHHEEG